MSADTSHARTGSRWFPFFRPAEDIDEERLTVGELKKGAVGVPAVAHSMEHALREMGPIRSAQTLLKLNQTDGFDCMSCAWADPDPDHRSEFEFCENGAKAVAYEATRKRVKPEFFAQHSIPELYAHDDFWLGRQGRLTQPMYKPEDSDHYVPVTWDEAFRLIAEQLHSIDPDEATFYTSGRTSNEAAYAYQLFVRGYGTNNLPDCSNMCHESSGEALGSTIGIGKGSVSLHDLETAKLILIAGQNPGTNHPRMLTSLERAKQNGGTIVAINPLPEAGLMHYRNPQTVHGIIGKGTQLADHYLQIRLGGDQSLFRGFGKVLLEAERAGKSTIGMKTVFDHDFIDTYTTGFDTWLEAVEATTWDEIIEATGLTEEEIRTVGSLFLESNRTVVAWAMGLTQHKHSVPSIEEIVNVVLSQGNIGREGAGLLPVRGHSNVQGDRTMGIFERMPKAFHDAIDAEYNFASPREVGVDAVNAIRHMRDGKTKFFMGMGGNFLRATPDTNVTEAALRSCEMTVQVSTKLNHSHLAPGKRAIILPTLGRTDQDVQKSGPQRITVEDSMAMVHASTGKLIPPDRSPHSEIAIVCHLARAVLCDADGTPKQGTPQVDWQAMMDDYRVIRRMIQATVRGFDDFEKRIDVPGGFKLPHPPADERRFETATGKALFTAAPLEFPHVPEGRLILQTVRSHDQYNTTIYGEDDRYRGIKNGRRVVFVSEDDLNELGFTDGEIIDMVSEWTDGSERRAENFRLVKYDSARKCATAYFPEANVLVPLDSTADKSGTPTSKSIIIRLERASGRGSGAEAFAPRRRH